MSELTPLHRRALAAGMTDIERRIADLEAALGAHATSLSKHTNDLSVEQHREIRLHFEQIRQAIMTCARAHDIPVPFGRRSASLRWIMQSGLSMLRVAVDDLGARRLKGYGAVSEPARRELVQCQNSIGRLIDALIEIVQEPSDDSP